MSARAPVEELLNVGPTSAAWLKGAGVHTLADLEELGAVEAFRRVRSGRGGLTSLNLLWALEGALLELRWDLLPADVKARLRAELDAADRETGAGPQ